MPLLRLRTKRHGVGHVEVENKGTLLRFLELLVEDLGGPDMCRSCTFMFDQQNILFYNI